MNRKRKLIFTSTCTLFIILFFLIIPDTFALNSTNDTQKEKLKELKEKEVKYKDSIKLKNKEETIIRNQVKELEKESKEIENKIGQKEEDIRKINSSMGDIENKISQKNNAIKFQKEILKKILLSKYQTTSYEKNIKRLFSPTSSESFSSEDRVEQTTTKIHEMMHLIEKEQDILKKNKSKLEQQKIDIKNAQFELSEQNLHLEDTKNYKTLLARQVSAEKSNLETKLKGVLLEQMQVLNEINSLSTTQIGKFSLSDLPSKQEAGFTLPVKKPYITTQGYGKTSYSHHYRGGYHNGIDFGARGSKTIMSAGDGVVSAVGHMGRYGYGNWIAIDHLNGLVTLYGHLSMIGVSKGQQVKAGESIGIMGTTGFSTGVHLHFSVFAQKTFRIVESTRVKGLYIPTGGTVNPLMYLF